MKMLTKVFILLYTICVMEAGLPNICALNPRHVICQIQSSISSVSGKVETFGSSQDILKTIIIQSANKTENEMIKNLNRISEDLTGKIQGQFSYNMGSLLESIDMLRSEMTSNYAKNMTSCIPRTLPVLCKGTDYMCQNEQCISLNKVCDGKYDCSDMTDEDPNICNGAKTCQGGQWRCKNTEELSCIKSNYVCDGIYDCMDYSDEFECGRKSRLATYCAQCTGPRLFQCQDGYCRSSVVMCDGTYDCFDGSDERFDICESGKKAACSSNFQCQNAKCISWISMCDGIDDCGDLSDECGINCFAKWNICNSTNSTSTSDPFNWLSSTTPYPVWPPETTYDYSVPGTTSDSTDIPSMCMSYQWQCQSGECIPSSYKCDAFVDCYDHSDEINCECLMPKFRCGNDECIARGKVCSGVTDCLDLSDEANCTESPFSGAYQCKNGFRWLAKNYLCNGHDDCGDFSDELNCECKYYQQSCNNTKVCISNEMLCDGLINCPDGEDESRCSCPNPDDYMCKNSSICIAQKFRCDFLSDCPYSDDEIGCPKTVDSFTCTDGVRIPQMYICNGMPECADGGDEMMDICVEKCIESNDHFLCNNEWQCLHIFFKCNGIVDCYDSSDEKDCEICPKTHFQCVEEPQNITDDTYYNFQNVSFVSGRLSWPAFGNSDQSGIFKSIKSGPKNNPHGQNNIRHIFSGRHQIELSFHEYPENHLQHDALNHLQDLSAILHDFERWLHEKNTQYSDKNVHKMEMKLIDHLKSMYSLLNHLEAWAKEDLKKLRDADYRVIEQYQFAINQVERALSQLQSTRRQESDGRVTERKTQIVKLICDRLNSQIKRNVDGLKQKLRMEADDLREHHEDKSFERNNHDKSRGQNAPYKPPNFFVVNFEVDRTVSSSGQQCILNSFVCDRMPHCPNWEDEMNCECMRDVEIGCFNNGWNGPCTSKSAIIRSGDIVCPFPKARTPSPERSTPLWSCVAALAHSGHSDKICNGAHDCLTGEDEFTSLCSVCLESEFACSKLDCIDGVKVCDGVFDCIDGTDEQLCERLLPTNVQLGILSKAEYLEGFVYLNRKGVHGFLSVEGITKTTDVNIENKVCKKFANSDWIRTTINSTISVGDFADSNIQLVVGESEDLFKTNPVFPSKLTRSTPFNRTLLHITCAPQKCDSPIPTRQKRTVHGRDSTTLSRPSLINIFVKWEVSYYVSGEVYRGEEIGSCSAVLLNQRWILTAAHCITYMMGIARPFDRRIFEASMVDIIVLYGTSRTILYEWKLDDITHRERMGLIDDQFLIVKPEFNKNVFRVDDFTRGSFVNDLALIKLSRNLTFRTDLMPACLPSTEDAKSWIPGVKCTAVGWGMREFSTESGPQLNEVDLELLPVARCAQALANGMAEGGRPVGLNQSLADLLDSDSMLCAHAPRRGICYGDSGGALFCPSKTGTGQVLAGVNSLTLSKCALDPSKPDIFANVNNAIRWIKEKINN